MPRKAAAGCQRPDLAGGGRESAAARKAAAAHQRPDLDEEGGSPRATCTAVPKFKLHTQLLKVRVQPFKGLLWLGEIPEGLWGVVVPGEKGVLQEASGGPHP